MRVKEVNVALLNITNDEIEKANLFFNEYTKQNQTVFNINHFDPFDTIDFIEKYQPIYDIIFIVVPNTNSNGLVYARDIREIDGLVTIVLVSDDFKVVVRAYELNALTYAKSYNSFEDFSLLMNAAISSLNTIDQVVINYGVDSFVKLNLRDIYYIVKDKNYLLIATDDNVLRIRGSMKELEEKLINSSIIKIANGCMVNLLQIHRKEKNVIYVKDQSFRVTEPYQDIIKNRLKGLLNNY